MLGERNSKSFEREPNKVTNDPSLCQVKLISRININIIMNIENRNRPTRHVGLAESIEMLSGEFNARLSQEMDSLMNLMQTQTK